MWRSSRVSALRREPNSLGAPEPPAQHRPHERVREQAARERGQAQSQPFQFQPSTAVVCAEDQGSYLAPLQSTKPAHCVGSSGVQSVPRAAVSLATPAVGRCGRLEYVASNSRQRGAGSTCCAAPGSAVPWRGHSHCGLSKALPNPSFKPSPNSKTPGPRCSVGVHFLQRVPGVLLSVPA